MGFKAVAQHAPVIVHQTYSLATDMVSGNFFIADRAYEVLEIAESHDAPSTSGTLQVERLQGTEAPGGGDDLLTSTVDLSGADDTVVYPTLTTTLTHRRLERGDRLAAVFGGTVTNGIAVCISVVLKPVGDWRSV